MSWHPCPTNRAGYFALNWEKVKSGFKLIRPEPKIKIKSEITIKMGRVREVYTSRGHLTRHTVTASVNTGDFVHLTQRFPQGFPARRCAVEILGRN